MIINHVMSCYYFCNQRVSTSSNLNSLLRKMVYKYYSSILSIFYGAEIPYTAKIGSNIKFNHSFYGIFISRTCVIGNGCTILQNVTIGSNQPLSGDSPTIGDNVFIGANSAIIGKCVIGDDCIIGAGTTIASAKINKGSTVVGAKFRIL